MAAAALQGGEVSSTEPIHLGCEIFSIEEPIRGLVRDRHGRAVEFRGWIELAAALTDLAGDATRSLSNPRPKESTS